MAKPTTIDDYVATFEDPARDCLVKIRALCREAVPKATEQIKWGHPAYVHPDGVILFMFSGHKDHAGVVFTPSTRAAFDKELADWETGKGTVKLPYDAKLPRALLRRMMAHRLREFEDDGVKWM